MGGHPAEIAGDFLGDAPTITRDHLLELGADDCDVGVGELNRTVFPFRFSVTLRSCDLGRSLTLSGSAHGNLQPDQLFHVFVVYAEDRGLLSSDPIFANNSSLTGMFERLRADDGRYPDTMDQRYGAWAQFLTLFWLVHEGRSHGDFRIPPRHGYLFDPDRYPFLEGRNRGASRSRYR